MDSTLTENGGMNCSEPYYLPLRVFFGHWRVSPASGCSPEFDVFESLKIRRTINPSASENFVDKVVQGS